MIPAARFTSSAIASTLLSVAAVSAFSQSNTRAPAASLETASLTAASAYDPARASPAQAVMPDNLGVAPGLSDVVRTMLQRSGTFRRQCARIAGAPQLAVRIEWAGRLLPGARAQTRIVRQGVEQVAVVQIPALDDTVELIAHEIEHVVEQLDGIDLGAHARRTHSSVHAVTADGVHFETRRACRVGWLVAQEVRQWRSRVYSQARR